MKALRGGHMATKKETSKPKVEKKQVSDVDTAVNFLNAKGYKVEAWEDKDRDLVWFRTEKDKSVRQLSFSPQSVAREDFGKELHTILTR